MTTREELVAAQDVRDNEWRAYKSAVFDGTPVSVGDMRRAFLAGFDFGEAWMRGEGDRCEHAALVVRHHQNGGVFDARDELEAIEIAARHE